MTEVESRVNNLETKTFNLEMQVSNLSTKVDAFIQEMRDFKTEMRDKDNQRAAEIAEMRQKHDAMNVKIDEKFDKLSSQIQNMAIAAVIGVGAIVWAVISVVK
mgnify:CR=1 FL=1